MVITAFIVEVIGCGSFVKLSSHFQIEEQQLRTFLFWSVEVTWSQTGRPETEDPLRDQVLLGAVEEQVAL